MPPADAVLDRATSPGHRRAWGWAAALRAGATTPWADWAGEAEPFARSLPGAQQLELLRRLNLAAIAQRRSLPAGAADRVLRAGVSGRGRGELALVGSEEAARFGPRPVDPATLPDDELLRVAAGILADDVAATAADAEPDRSLVEKVRAARLPWRDPFVVVGDPWVAEAVRAGLLAHGPRPGGRRPTAYLLAGDLATVVAHAWTARAFDQGGLRWTEFLEAFARSGHVPPRADLPRMARSAVKRYGEGRVTIVLDPDALARQLGVAALATPPRLGAHAIDLVRRVGEPLGLLVATERRPALLRATLGARLDGLGGPPPTIPPRWETWLRTQAERTRHELEAGDYPVLGDLDGLLPGALAEDAVVPVDAEVLALALGLLLDPLSPAPRPPATEEEP